MQHPDGRETKCTGERIAEFVQQHFLWLLLGCYLLATALPGPGQAMHRWYWSLSAANNGRITLPLVLLAVMLFCAALLTNWEQIRVVLRHPWVLCAALAAVWLGPALLVVIAGWIVPHVASSPEIAGLLVGLALVATMPVANSSVGWVQNAGGNLALALALVVMSISLCPLVTPQLLSLLGMSLSPAEQARCEILVNNFSGWFFVIWVILPTIAGFAARYVLAAPRATAMTGWITLTSAVALFLLNYMNSALALPKIGSASAELLAATMLLAVALSAVGLVLGWALARVLRVRPATRSALCFGLSMKHTGLALTLAGEFLADQPPVILLIVLATLAQHLLAAIVQWWQVPESATDLV